MSEEEATELPKGYSSPSLWQHQRNARNQACPRVKQLGSLPSSLWKGDGVSAGAGVKPPERSLLASLLGLASPGELPAGVPSCGFRTLSCVERSLAYTRVASSTLSVMRGDYPLCMQRQQRKLRHY